MTGAHHVPAWYQGVSGSIVHDIKLPTFVLISRAQLTDFLLCCIRAGYT